MKLGFGLIIPLLEYHFVGRVLVIILKKWEARVRFSSGKRRFGQHNPCHVLASKCIRASMGPSIHPFSIRRICSTNKLNGSLARNI